MSEIFNKHRIVEKIVATLLAELEGYSRSARAAHAEATNEQSKAENKYDTRGLEASYLARGQSRQAAEVAESIEQLESLTVREFAAGEAIALGALVELEQEGARVVYFVAPRAGGTEVECDGQTVWVITPQSPLGQQLVGRRGGERLQIKTAGMNERVQISAVM